MQPMLEQCDKRYTNEDKSRHREGHNNLRCEGVGIGDQSQHIAEQQEHKQGEDEGEIRAAFMPNITAHHFGNKFIHHFSKALHTARNKRTAAHSADQKCRANANSQHHK